jgi:hypothetical protein
MPAPRTSPPGKSSLANFICPAPLLGLIEDIGALSQTLSEINDLIQEG